MRAVEEVILTGLTPRTSYGHPSAALRRPNEQSLVISSLYHVLTYVKSNMGLRFKPVQCARDELRHDMKRPVRMRARAGTALIPGFGRASDD